ncbi:hypothetical protein Bca52824_096883 [Brassica carinata]|uniref:Uncharacterized protein n=1 Tax=Brassica carinata TaxID=52824 RepID=A0A8X7NY72_BRACI|nr:hypothetical protein Bca52824_096883 [Brassica carinata]
MNPHKTEEDLFHHHDLDPTNLLSQSPHPSIHHHSHNPEDDPTFSPGVRPLPLLTLPRLPIPLSDEQDSLSHPTPETPKIANPRISISTEEPRDWDYINPEPHISSHLHIQLRIPLPHDPLPPRRPPRLPAEIRVATPRSVLKSWRSVWKDRNEDTAYVTAWKRIQDKLTARLDPASGNEFLCFKTTRGSSCRTLASGRT